MFFVLLSVTPSKVVTPFHTSAFVERLTPLFLRNIFLSIVRFSSIFLKFHKLQRKKLNVIFAGFFFYISVLYSNNMLI